MFKFLIENKCVSREYSFLSFNKYIEEKEFYVLFISTNMKRKMKNLFVFINRSISFR